MTAYVARCVPLDEYGVAAIGLRHPDNGVLVVDTEGGRIRTAERWESHRRIGRRLPRDSLPHSACHRRETDNGPRRVHALCVATHRARWLAEPLRCPRCEGDRMGHTAAVRRPADDGGRRGAICRTLGPTCQQPELLDRVGREGRLRRRIAGVMAAGDRDDEERQSTPRRDPRGRSRAWTSGHSEMTPGSLR